MDVGVLGCWGVGVMTGELLWKLSEFSLSMIFVVTCTCLFVVAHPTKGRNWV